jgi:hypothetical protein
MLHAQRKRFYMAITLMNTVCYTLSRDRLYGILENFPEVRLPALTPTCEKERKIPRLVVSTHVCSISRWRLVLNT